MGSVSSERLAVVRIKLSNDPIAISFVINERFLAAPNSSSKLTELPFD